AAERGAGRGHHAVGGRRLGKSGKLAGPETDQDSCDSTQNRDESAHERWLLIGGSWAHLWLRPRETKNGCSTTVRRTCYGRSTIGGSMFRRKRPPKRSGGLSRS